MCYAKISYDYIMWLCCLAQIFLCWGQFHIIVLLLGWIFYPDLIGVSKFLGTLSNSLRENISHVTAAAAVTSDGPEPVFDRMQVFVQSGVLQFQFLCFLKFFMWSLSFPGTDCHSYCPSLELLHLRSFS